MTLNEYQTYAMETCMDSCDNFSYMFINLVGELGEFASKIAKLIRKEKAEINNNHLVSGSLSLDDYSVIRKEAGDCLWQLAGLCNVMGWTLEEVAQENLDKLADRKSRHVIDGSGDER